MKRILGVALIFSLLFSLCACREASTKIKDPVNFYYRTRDIHYETADGVVVAEVHEGYGNTEDYAYLIEQYLKGPMSKDYISPFPAGTSLESVDLVMNRVHIVLSAHLSMLTGSDLIIACTCLTKTILDITGAKSVQISSSDSLLDGKNYITLNADSYAIWDDFPNQISES